MKEFIQHCLEDHPDEILKKSIKNCHVAWMHSIMFDSSGRKIRMFYTDKNHDLWKNLPEYYEDWLSLWFHPHHCNISIVPLVWEILNWTVNTNPEWEIECSEYMFRSHIKSGAWGFEKIGEWVRLQTKQLLHLNPWQKRFMPADELHSVWVNQWNQAAWIVLEWEESSKNHEQCYSNTDHENIFYSILSVYYTTI